MVRAVLVGLLGLAPLTGCKGKEADQVAPSVAGKVVEVSGQVTAKGKPLAVGDSVAVDDEIETGTDGRAIIELAHNGARWELGPSKKQKVSASIAWNLPKKDGNAKSVDQDTAAAGRPAERNAAESGTSGAPSPSPAIGGPQVQPADPTAQRAPTAQPTQLPPPPKAATPR